MEGNDKEKEYMISSKQVIESFTREQEEIIDELIQHIDKPFKDLWDYLKWQRKAIIYQLSYFDSDNFFLMDRALFGMLILNDEGRDDISDPKNAKATREWVIQLMHNDLIVIFANARNELARREGNNDKI